MPQSGGSLDLGLNLGLTSQGSLSSSTTSGALSPWAAALSSVGQSPRRPLPPIAIFEFDDASVCADVVRDYIFLMMMMQMGTR